ncbi:DNA polymerase III subunit delta' [Alkalibacterium iburiense]|uniref:DNA polymerase III subunit delta n=1 Tax=Alkalibacterium iburiense TaxID=290589 RepID=A0ABN0XN42_9LACT
MSTNTIKQPSIQRLFLHLLNNNTMQHAYLFEGKMGTGKKETALWTSQGIFCENRNEEGPCQSCHNCQRIRTHHHPDIVEVEPDGLSIKINQVRALKEEFSKSGMESRKKIVIVEDVEKMTIQAANSLLKFLEEPEGEITVFLLTTAKHRLLPTILSRCQLIHFPQLPKAQQRLLLEEAGLSKERAALLCHLTSDKAEALELSEDENFQNIVKAVWKWYVFLSKKDDQAFIFVHTDIMPLVKDKKEHTLVLDLLLILLQDVLNSQITNEHVFAFIKKEEDIKRDADRLSSLALANMMEIILTGKKQLESNVAAQGVFESCTLQLLNELK